MIDINPFAAIEQLLSEKGLEALRIKHSPPIQYHWEENDEGEMVGEADIPELSPREVESIQSALLDQLESLIDDLKNDVDTRTFNLNSDKERGDLCTFVSKRIELTIERWQKLPSSKDHPDSFILLNNVKAHLSSLSSLWVNDEVEQLHQSQKVRPVIHLPDNFKLAEHSLKVEKLNLRQTALLFSYLKDHDVILEYEAKPLSYLIHLLTGHSAHNLRVKGFGHIEYIKDGLSEEGKVKKDFNADIIAVIDLLKSIISDLDIEAKENSQNQSKK